MCKEIMERKFVIVGKFVLNSTRFTSYPNFCVNLTQDVRR